MSYRSDDLEREVRRRTRLPNATDITSAEIFEYADQEMQSVVADVMRNGDASFWVSTQEHSIVAGTSTYAIPRRAIGGGIERIETQDSTGRRQEVVPVSEYDTWRWTNGRDAHWPGRFGYTLDAEDVRLWPPPTSADAGLTLRIRYHRQPSKIDDVDNCAAISEASGVTALVVQAGIEALTDLAGSVLATEASIDITTEGGDEIVTEQDVSEVSRYVDIVRGDGVHESLYIDRVMTSYVGDAATLSASTPVTVASIASTTIIGGRVDYLCRAGYTPYPQIPASLWPLLVSRTCAAVLEALGSGEQMARATAVAASREASARSIITPRSRDVAPRINRTSYLRRGHG